ncbi:uncharacterized protein LOC142985205 [Anticarsia gemmatalis]|uniref:uncharacterized protein LOC142985205 n=1 Tax=Anticarsia gemmatalis TaxID=129554 RepID=UPI003F76036F
MDIKFDSVVDLVQSNVCRCCLSSGCFKDISSEYYYSGQKEVYENMLKDTFNIQLLQQDIEGYTSQICEECIQKLREAYTFKNMVIQSEQRLAEIIDRIKCNERDKLQNELKLEEIKAESPVMDYCEDSFDDDGINPSEHKIGIDAK